MNKDQYIKHLEFQLDKYKSALKLAGIDFFDINTKTGEAVQSEYITEKLGYTTEETNTFEKRNAIFHPGDLEVNLNEVEKLHKGQINTTDLLFRLYSKSGEIHWIKHDGLMINDYNQTPHFIGILRDITDEKKYLESLHHMASYDSLTGAFNRRVGLSKLNTDMQSDQNVIIVYADLDHFKQINDLYSHEHGDQILKKYADSVNTIICDQCYLIRLGGDEFLIVFVGHQQESVEKMIQQIEDTPITYGDNNLLSACYGLVEYNHKIHDSDDQLINQADKVMYDIKATKRKK